MDRTKRVRCASRIVVFGHLTSIRGTAIGAMRELTDLTMNITSAPSTSGAAHTRLPATMNVVDDTLASLLRLPLRDRLTALHLTCWIPGVNFDGEWTTDQIRVLRQFTRLRKLHLRYGRWSTREFNDLLAEPLIFMMPLVELILGDTMIVPEMVRPALKTKSSNFNRWE